MTTPARVIEEALTWQRTPWHHMARVKHAGVDCAQLLIAVYGEVLGIPTPEVDAYSIDWACHRSEEILKGYLEKYARKVEVPQPADIVIYKYGRCYSHAGIVVDWPIIIHAFRKASYVMQDDGTQGDLADREPLFYRVNGL